MSRITFRGGVHPPGNKQYSRDASFREYLPVGEMVYPVNQHIGKPAKPVVKKGDKVLAGQLIAEADGFVSANIYSSCSGTVKALEPRRTAMGTMALSVVIDNDGKFEQAQGFGQKREWKNLSKEEIIGAVRQAGIVGLGGAGFPTSVKLAPKNADEIEYVIANGAECEPYITCDDQLMRTYPDEIAEGLALIVSLFPKAKGIVLIEDNKPEAAGAMRAACQKQSGLEVLVAKTKYPQGGERSIISLVTGKHLKNGMLPADAGCIVDNVATVRAVYRAVCLGEPLFQKAISVTGDAVASPANLITRIGVSYRELLEAAGGVKEGTEAKKLLSGGPMMGIALSSLDVPMQKAHNALTALTKDEVETAQIEMTACLRCGRCGDVCPLGLTPQMMAVAAENKDYDRYEKKLYGLECIACGSCTFICPARRPLMQLFKQTKAEIMAAKRRGAGK